MAPGCSPRSESDRTRFTSARNLKAYAGSAPVVACRAAGDWNHQAERHLFNKFLGQLHHCLQTRTRYDEHHAFLVLAGPQLDT